MDKNYQWGAALTVDSGGYVGEAITVEKDGQVLFSGAVDNPPQTFGTGWTTTSETSGDAEYTYTYRDSDRTRNDQSTKVAVTVRDVWTASIDDANNLTIKVNTTIVSASRTVIGAVSNVPRHIWIRRNSDAPVIREVASDNASTAHTIMTNVNLGEYTMTIPPGSDSSRATIYWRSTSVGHEGDPIPNIYTDILKIGVHFRNPLPPDYRPGATWDGSTWQSHNRNNGACHMYTGSTYKEMRTNNGPAGTNDPPYIKHSDTWHNQRKIGANG